MTFDYLLPTALLHRFCDLSWGSLVELKQWFQRGTARDGFTLDSLNPSLHVATATNAIGENICHFLAEPCVMVSAFVRNPRATQSELQRAGDVVDAAFAHKARKDGVSKLLLVIPGPYPPVPNEKWVRVVEKPVPQIAAMNGVGYSTNSALIN